ncbi:MAG: hypothetical protein KF906_02095 [Actinobacteria bacterium]|nr:hypothetical protein [Actinomycetota bacterium]
MDDEKRDAPRLRDLGDERRPVAGTSDFTSVGDVGELPYAAEVEPEAPQRNVAALVAVLAVVLALVIGLGLAFLV